MVLEDYGMQLFLGISFRECPVEILISVFLNGMPMLKMNWVVALVLQSWVWMEHSRILIACEFLITIFDIVGKLQFLLHRRCHSLDLLILVSRYTQKFDIIHGDLHDLHDTKSFLSSLEELAGYFRNDVKHHVREYKAATAFFNWEVVFFYLNSHFYFLQYNQFVRFSFDLLNAEDFMHIQFFITRNGIPCDDQQLQRRENFKFVIVFKEYY